MSILGNFSDNRTEEKRVLSQGYKIPSIVANKQEDLPLKKSVILSTIIHFATAGTTWLIALIMLILGINIKLFNHPDVKKKDIEFVLVDREDTPLNKNTRYRADRNSRTGGINDPKKPVSLPSPAPGKPSVAQQQASPTPKKAQSQAPKSNNIFKQITTAVTPAQKPAENTASAGPKKAEEAKPQPPTARPSIKPQFTPKAVTAPTSNFQVPVPSGGTGSGKYVSGPISGSGSSSVGGGNGGIGSGTGAGPKLAPTGSGSGTGSRLAQGGGGGGTGIGGGNPGGGGGRPGIDAIREPDFGPYMRDLQRRIKMNWDPPKGDESKRVVLLFKIAKDGRLLSCSVYKSSGLPSADKAALHAVQLTAPFKPLPAAYSGNSIDIQFTFDYNVFGAAGYQ